MFDTISGRLGEVFARLRSKGSLNEADVDSSLSEAKLVLLEADVNLAVVKSLLARVRHRAVGTEVSSSLTPGQQVIKIIHEELITTLGRQAAPLARGSKSPDVILISGLQGSGKTTSAAKIAAHLSSRGRHPMLVAADLQRPAAVDQLQQLGDRIGVPVYSDKKHGPERLARMSVKEARRSGRDVVVIDTAGRFQIEADMMAELKAISNAVQPQEVLLVVDAMTGQQSVNVATGFLEHVDITGIVITKLDGDARGGAAISAREVVGRPIKFVGVGEGLHDLEIFHPERMASRILGMGDVLTLIEKTEAAYDEEKAVNAAEKIMTARFDLEDFLEQFQQLRKMGPLQSLVSMLPGAGQAVGDVEIDEDDLRRVEAIIRAMTPDERRNPKSINGSRKRRIARGSGTTPQDVNSVLKKFNGVQKMMKTLAGGKSPIPGLSLPGMSRTRKR